MKALTITILSFLFVCLSPVFAAAPTVGTITATDPITLIASSTATGWCNATITDEDGYADVNTVNATLWDPGATAETSGDDNNNHYTNSSCVLSGGSGTTINAACSFDLQYYANAGEWTCKLTAADTTATGDNNITDVTVNVLKALSVTSTLAFGEYALGHTTSNAEEESITVTNTGNTEIDISLDGYGSSDGDGYAMVCTIGGSEIPLANLRYNLTAGQDFDVNMTSLTDTAVTLTDFNLSQETVDGTPSTKNIFWKLRIPTTDIGGSCTGNLLITAV